MSTRTSLMCLTPYRLYVTSSPRPVIDARGLHLTNWCTRRTWEKKVLMQQQQQSRGILLITRSANLIFQLWPMWRVSREEEEEEVVVVRRGGGTLTAQEEGGLGDTSRTKGLCVYAAVCQRGFPRPPPSLTLWSHRERSRAWRCRWRCWSSSSLSVVSSSAPPGNAGEHWEDGGIYNSEGRPQEVTRNLIKHS